MIDTDTETKLTDALRKTIPYLREESSAYADDGDNEPLELVREIESLLIDHNDAIEDAYEAENNPDTARAQPASAPGGWVVVPSAPTSAMVEACVKLKLDRLKGFMEGDYEPKDVRQSTVEDWLAMLAAAPQPAKECDR